MNERSPAHNALLNYNQADEDGVMVLVSRQAIHEVSDEIAVLRAELTVIAALADKSEPTVSESRIYRLAKAALSE